MIKLVGKFFNKNYLVLVFINCIEFDKILISYIIN